MPRRGADREFHSGFHVSIAHSVGHFPIRIANDLKLVSHGLDVEGHLLLGIYWASLSHWLCTWDTLVWIGGFAAIEMNVSEWREELVEEKNEND